MLDSPIRAHASERRINSPELSRLYLQIDEESKAVLLPGTEPVRTNRTRAEPEPFIMARLHSLPHAKQRLTAAPSELF
ncbi:MULTISPECIES: hypothetical protein [Nitrosomonas]|uniref:Uncharacterized protein n=1 Tax=Nitrosomonas communis TaxID=44574 RepID=A0A5D3Y916_9PROT|nr:MULTISPECIES: hypothetical protein [Nitrosomonas]TYP78420.1 hypothetical protein BCL69_10732 [Nitrosomonas communis]UVS60020.1 hypothetical protein NX761_10745 [Nitrosomonas sp. PLL12]